MHVYQYHSYSADEPFTTIMVFALIVTFFAMFLFSHPLPFLPLLLNCVQFFLAINNTKGMNVFTLNDLYAFSVSFNYVIYSICTLCSSHLPLPKMAHLFSLTLKIHAFTTTVKVLEYKSVFINYEELICDKFLLDTLLFLGQHKCNLIKSFESIDVQH